MKALIAIELTGQYLIIGISEDGELPPAPNVKEMVEREIPYVGKVTNLEAGYDLDMSSCICHTEYHTYTIRVIPVETAIGSTVNKK